MKSVIKISLIGFLSGVAGSFAYQNFFTNESADHFFFTKQEETYNPPTFTIYPENLDSLRALAAIENLPFNQSFVNASAASAPCVVYIKTVAGTDYGRSSWLDLFFEGRTGQKASSGSGVIYSKDGYIVTNNHVIENAEVIEIIHNKQSYEGKVIGVDPSTDLAVVKIEGAHLPAIGLGSSKSLQVGEWVLAVGNPFNLATTVTAGIVSGKGREINILKSQFPIESFIQTDAAINPGNSGGALVNTKGELVGINTAILSKTGSYTGYGFAVPVDIVKKVVEDLIKYGEVQKAFFGGDVMDLEPAIAKRLNLKDYSGVILSYIQKEGAAEKAELKKGDIILKIDNEPIDSRSAFEEQMSYYSPGDKVKVTYKRDGNIYEKTLILTNREGTTSILKREVFTSKALGAELETVPKVERNLLNIEHGVRVTKVRDGFIRRLGIQEGFVITAINKIPVKTPEQLNEILTQIKGKVVIEGINSSGMKGYYSFWF
jgi:serine protease Do